MSDAAYAAASPTSVELGGKSFDVYPLTLKDWGHLERLAVQDCKRTNIETTTKNLDLVPEGLREGMVKEAFEKAGKITVETLPKKALADPDGGEIEVDYMLWWVDSTFAGRLSYLWLSMRKGQEGLTLEDVDVIIQAADPAVVREAVESVGSMSGANVGNSESPRKEVAVEG